MDPYLDPPRIHSLDSTVFDSAEFGVQLYHSNSCPGILTRLVLFFLDHFACRCCNLLDRLDLSDGGVGVICVGSSVEVIST